MLKVSNPRFRLYGSVRDAATVCRRMAAGRWDRGAEIADLERQIETRFEIPHAICTATARLGIFLAVRALSPPGRQVILSPYTISDVVNMVVCAGGVPVFADIDQDTANISPREVERLIGPDTGAVLVTHLHGLACDVERIRAVCATHAVPLIEDAAQAFGARLAGRPVGTLGNVGVFSFGMYKNVNAYFGGMLVTSSSELARRLRDDVESFRAQGRSRYLVRLLSGTATRLATFPPLFRALTYRVVRQTTLHGGPRLRRWTEFDLAPALKRTLPQSYRRRMTPTQARLVLNQLPGVTEANAARVAAASEYDKGLSGLKMLRLPPFRDDFSHTYTYYPVQVAERDRILKEMVRAGRDVAAQHLRNCADLECFAEFRRDCPAARAVASQTMLLPTYPRYGGVDVLRNIAELRAILGA